MHCIMYPSVTHLTWEFGMEMNLSVKLKETEDHPEH